ncbi:MAG: 50S ribosomal protein L32 [Chloroflexi bacterium]|nr:50S ribosomal protein L32 [Chloroflexota bacterium]
MAPHPKRRFSRARHGNRTSHFGLRARSLSVCPQCRSPKLPHRACPACGSYNGRQVLAVAEAGEKAQA